MKVLIIGSGGREHAVLWALRATSRTALDLYCAPGNAGIIQIARCVPIEATDIAALVQFAVDEPIDLTFVGPEGPLAAGIVDAFEAEGLVIAGPSKAAARLESSKAFAKQFMARHQIPTARFALAASVSEARDQLRSGKFGAADSPVVIKADGLAAGKGVVVAATRVEAEQAVQGLMMGGLVPAEAAQQILIEEALQGREVSLLLFTDGTDYSLMPAARDHKRIGEGDTGPNTGGMGAITDPSILDDATLAQVVREVVEPTLEGARAEGFTFRGVLFIGLMLTEDGPRVLEYNVRFGDPETQAILVRLRSDLAEIFQAIAGRASRKLSAEWSRESSACVVLASRGYPGKSETGKRVTGMDTSRHEQVQIFHAGTSLSTDRQLLTVGGRVLGVTATGPRLDEALGLCYRAIADIHWEGMQYRRDIGRFETASGSSQAAAAPVD